MWLPRCDAHKGDSRIEKRRQFDCNSCGYQFSVRAGTIFHDSHLPLWKWFLAVYAMGASNTSLSANQLERMLGISYKTAWYLRHRIRAAMRHGTLELLRGSVQARREVSLTAGLLNCPRRRILDGDGTNCSALRLTRIRGMTAVLSTVLTKDSVTEWSCEA